MKNYDLKKLLNKEIELSYEDKRELERMRRDKNHLIIQRDEKSYHSNFQF